MLSWRRPPTSINDLMDAILENRRLIIAMADALTTALADLNTAVSHNQSAVEAATADIHALLQQLLVAAGTGLTQEMTDAAAQIEARVGDINAASTALGNAAAQPVQGNTTITRSDPTAGNVTTGNLSLDTTV